jgi:putative ABC transport system permease protein
MLLYFVVVALQYRGAWTMQFTAIRLALKRHGVLPMLVSTMLMALRAIRRNLPRSLLTILGVVIGVAAVITMVTLGTGATQSFKDQISSLGSNLLMARPGRRFDPSSGTASAPTFTEGDVMAIMAQVVGVKAVAPELCTGATVTANGRNWTTSITDTTNAFFQTNNWNLASGRIFEGTEELAGASVCLIGDTVRQGLFGRADVLGEHVRIKQFSCDVIGVLAPKGRATMGNDQDDIVLLPLRTVQRRVVGNHTVSTLLISMTDGSNAERVKNGLTQLLRERRKLAPENDDNFSVLDTKEIAEALSGTMRVMTALLGAVAAVSLLVGGIGIMNIMLVSVTERTREIGLRLAIGALERDVLLQFLVEATTLSLLGGAVGIVVASLASIALATLMQVPYMFNAWINVASFLFSGVIGIIFGYIPARRAAQLDPIDALRYE